MKLALFLALILGNEKKICCILTISVAANRNRRKQRHQALNNYYRLTSSKEPDWVQVVYLLLGLLASYVLKSLAPFFRSNFTNRGAILYTTVLKKTSN